MDKEVADEDTASGDSERSGHVEHRFSAGLHGGLAHDLQPVRDRLDARVGPGTTRIGKQEERRETAPTKRGYSVLEASAHLLRYFRYRPEVQRDCAEDDNDMRNDKKQKDRRYGCDRFLYAAQVHHHEEADDDELDGQFPKMPIAWQEAEYGIFRSEEHTSELQSQSNLVCRLLLEKKNNTSKSAKTIKDTNAPRAGGC